MRLSCPLIEVLPFFSFVEFTAFQIWSMSSEADRTILKTADGASWLTPDELMNTVRGLLITQEAMDGDAVGILTGWRFDEMQSR